MLFLREGVAQFKFNKNVVYVALIEKQTVELCPILNFPVVVYESRSYPPRRIQCCQLWNDVAPGYLSAGQCCQPSNSPALCWQHRFRRRPRILCGGFCPAGISLPLSCARSFLSLSLSTHVRPYDMKPF